MDSSRPPPAFTKVSVGGKEEEQAMWTHTFLSDFLAQVSLAAAWGPSLPGTPGQL